MQLHELVNLRNSLQTAIDLVSIESAIERNQAALDALSLTADPEYQTTIASIVKHFDAVTELLPITTQETAKLIDRVQQEITERSSKFFASNYQLELSIADNDMLPMNTRNRRHWRRMRMDLDDSPDKHLLSRIFQHSSYKYPALEIGCRDGEFTQHLVASDPLYIADVHPEFLSSAVSMFPEEYQARVRKYLIKDYKIEGLPKNQFGFIFSYNFFNYLSFDSIKQLMISAQQWLRPGGTIIFTYNNSDLGVGAAYAESYYMSYVPRSMLVPMCESLGFKLIDHRDYEPNLSWVEFRKHGELTTVKASQALGEIMHINH
jgi:SAM-dependent methyltransferase